MKPLLYAIVLAVIPFLAVAQQLQMTSGDWRVFTYRQDGKNVCYIASVPVKKTGNYSKRDEPFALVTYRNATTDEVSVSSGYPYKGGSEATVMIDGKKFGLFTKGERGWAKDESADRSLIAAMTKGNSMKVKGTSPKGTFSEDGYSLKGFTAAHGKMKALCK